jgi:hypothetical protein
MKTIVIVLTLLLSTAIFGQSDSIEKAVLYKKVLTGEMSNELFSETGKEWKKAVQSIGKYPELQLDQNGKVYYTYLSGFKGLSKEYLYNRTMEWLTIYYGFVPADLNANPSEGKIIFRNSKFFKTNCNITYTAIITLKNEKMLVEYFAIVSQTQHAGYYSNDLWIPERIVTTEIENMYPVVLKKQSEWNTNLQMFKFINDHLNNSISDLNNYIANYDSMYAF